MSLDNTARKLADNLTNRFGKTVTLRRTTQTTYDPILGTGGTDNPPVDNDVKVTPPENFMFARINGTLIEEGDQIVGLPALNAPYEPSVDTDTLILENEEWRIKQIGYLWSGELVALYIIHLTK